MSKTRNCCRRACLQFHNRIVQSPATVTSTSSLVVKTHCVTGALWPHNVSIYFHFTASHTLAVQSLDPDTIKLPQLVKVSVRTQSKWPSNLFVTRRVVVDHTNRPDSADPETKLSPSGVKANAVVASSLPHIEVYLERTTSPRLAGLDSEDMPKRRCR